MTRTPTTVVEDPVEDARGRLRDAERRLENARERLLSNKTRAIAVENLLLGGRLYGVLHSSDPARQEAVQNVVVAANDYEHAWLVVEESRRAYEQAVQTYRRLRQAEWLDLHQPELGAALLHWQTMIHETAGNDHLLAHAKRQHMLALHAYQQALNSAPHDRD